LSYVWAGSVHSLHLHARQSDLGIAVIHGPANRGIYAAPEIKGSNAQEVTFTKFGPGVAIPAQG